MPKKFFLIWGLQSLVIIYSVITGFAISADVFIKSESALVMALIIFAQFGPRIYLSFFSGYFVDKHNVFAAIIRANSIEAILSLIASV